MNDFVLRCRSVSRRRIINVFSYSYSYSVIPGHWQSVTLSVTSDHDVLLCCDIIPWLRSFSRCCVGTVQCVHHRIAFVFHLFPEVFFNLQYLQFLFVPFSVDETPNLLKSFHFKSTDAIFETSSCFCSYIATGYINVFCELSLV